MRNRDVAIRDKRLDPIAAARLWEISSSLAVLRPAHSTAVEEAFQDVFASSRRTAAIEVKLYGPMVIGLAFMPVAVVMALFSLRFSAQLIGRFGPGAMLVAGQAVAMIALAAVALGPVHPNYFIHLMVPMALLGLGGGLSFPALTMIAMADVAPSDAGLASGLPNTTGQVGGAFGLAVLATVAGGRTLDLVRNGVDLGVALSGGFHFAWMVCAATVVMTLGVAAVVLRDSAAQPEIVEEPCVECEAAA